MEDERHDIFMKSILKKILNGCIVIIVAMALLPALYHIHVTGQIYIHIIAEEYLFWIGHPFKWIGVSILMIVIFYIAYLLLNVLSYSIQKFSNFLLSKSQVKTESNDFQTIYSGLGVLIFCVVVICIFSIIDEPSTDGLIIFGIHILLALWTLFSMLYSKSGLAIVKSYFLTMILYNGYVLLKAICPIQQFTVTWSSFNTDSLSHILGLIILFGILGLFIKGFLITYRPGFIKAFTYHKEISYFQILILISAFSCLVFIRNVSFDLSINNTDNKYPAINSTK